jgi:hypothetical protein
VRRRFGDTTQQPTPPTSVWPIREPRWTATRGAILARLRDLYRLHGTPLHEEVLLNQLLQDLTASKQPTSS